MKITADMELVVKHPHFNEEEDKAMFDEFTSQVCDIAIDVCVGAGMGCLWNHNLIRSP